MIEVSTISVVVILLQYINISNQQIVQFKFTQLYVHYISI